MNDPNLQTTPVAPGVTADPATPTAPVQPVTPDAPPDFEWKFGAPDPSSTARIATVEDVERIVRNTVRPGVNPEDMSSDEDRELAEIINSTDPVFAMKKQMELMQRRILTGVQGTMQQMAEQQQVPGMRSNIAAHIAQGLPDAARNYVETYLMSADAAGLRAIASNKGTLDILRDAAENVARRQAPAVGGTAAPRAGGAGTVGQPIAGIDEAEVQEIMTNLKFSRDQAVAMIKEAQGGH